MLATSGRLLPMTEISNAVPDGRSRYLCDFGEVAGRPR
jgi:hypothetical protein